MQILIPVSDTERRETIKAISSLNDIQHLKTMSQAMIGTTANIRPTKIRVILMDLIEKGYIIQYQVSDNIRVQRYYYVVTEEGNRFAAITG